MAEHLHNSAGRLVLVVDDDPHIRSGLARLLAIKGHEVIAGATVREGLEKLSAGPSHLLLDMNLPDGVGTTILGHIRTAQLPIKVAVLSGSGDAVLMEHARSLRPDKMFKKPPDWSAVIDWVSSS